MRGLKKNVRNWLAAFIALGYVACVLAPTAALAFTASPASFHCLAELTGLSAPTADDGHSHTHAHGAVQQNDQSGVADHQSGTGSKIDDGSCCGLFCVSALSHDPGLTFGVSTPASPVSSPVSRGLIGRAPSPLHRPPIA